MDMTPSADRNSAPPPDPRNLPPLPPLDEDLVADVRAHLTPAQMVERKLVSLLKANPLPVSHLTLTGPRTFRGR